MRFADGRVTEYSCGNFLETAAAGNRGGAGDLDGAGNAAGGPSAAPAVSCKAQEEAFAQGRELVKQVILRGHTSLPLGEFAIGTNTAAYAMARRFGIGGRLPILIAEKTGPHFAVGDTCYSFAEDSPMYNPDGKEVIARDNEISLLRKEDASKAYFSCHTDITIPYSELGDIRAVDSSGRETEIVRQGRLCWPELRSSMRRWTMKVQMRCSDKTARERSQVNGNEFAAGHKGTPFGSLLYGPSDRGEGAGRAAGLYRAVQ